MKENNSSNNVAQNNVNKNNNNNSNGNHNHNGKYKKNHNNGNKNPNNIKNNNNYKNDNNSNIKKENTSNIQNKQNANNINSTKSENNMYKKNNSMQYNQSSNSGKNQMNGTTNNTQDGKRNNNPNNVYYKKKKNNHHNSNKITNGGNDIRSNNGKNSNNVNKNNQKVNNVQKTNINVNDKKNTNKFDKSIGEKNNNQNTKNLGNKNTNSNQTVNHDQKIDNQKIKKENITKIESPKETNPDSNEECNKVEKKSYKYAIITASVFISFILFFSGYFLINYYSNKIDSNIFIENVNVSKLTKEQAKEVLLESYSDVLGKELKVYYNQNEYSLKLDEIDFDLLLDDAIDKAFKVGRDNNVLMAAKDFYTLTFGEEKQIDVDFNYDREKLNTKIMDIEKNFYKEVVQYSFKFENDKLKITNGTPGVSVNYDQFENELKNAIEEKSLSETIRIPVDIEKPDEINVNDVHDKVYVEMQNAFYTLNPFTIHKEVQGINFDILALKNMIEENPDAPEYIVDLILTDPTIKVDDLDLYNDVLASFSTGYVNNPNRTVNLRLAANKIDGTILMPGESFSYNDIVGERTAAAGYRNAAIFVNGEVEDGLAGGICQVSSTIYDAVVFANLQIDERYNHARVPSYISGGRDATVYWGSKDFKFTNNRTYPVKLSVDVSGGRVYVEILGKLEENEYDISIETAVVSRYNGYMVVNAYKVYRQNGEVVNRELLSTDSYKI